MKRVLVGLVLVWVSTGAIAALAKPRPASGTSRAVFEQRILPLMRAPNPSSCAECHLSGVDLKDYIRPSEAETFASLVKQGLVDRKNPGASRLLRLIRMASPKSSLVTQKARNTEYQAFKGWIEAASRNPALLAGRALPLGPKVPVEVIRHTRKDRVLASFTQNIWVHEGRCSGCHAEGSPGTARFAKQHGDRMGWIVPDNPEATFQKLLAQKLIDVRQPEKSLLLTKPIGAVKHGGGVKFAYGDRTYGMFLGWLQDYAKSVRAEYRDAHSLPAHPETRLVPTGSTLQIVDGPDAWIGKSLRVDLHAWDDQRKDWSLEPAGTGDRPFNRGHGSNLLVFRIVPAGTPPIQDAALPNGRYLLKYYLADIPPAQTSARPIAEFPFIFLGQQEFHAEWKRGKDEYTQVTPALAKVAPLPKVQKP